MKIAYRPATQEDFEFLFRLHEAAMRRYIEEAFGPWEAGWQRAYFQQHLDLPSSRIILAGDTPVGILRLQERTEEIFLASLEILPEFQRQGIGTAVVRDLQEDAAVQGKPVALQVLKVNILARSLYQRLGFGVTGENETHYIMAFYPKPGASQPGG